MTDYKQPELQTPIIQWPDASSGGLEGVTSEKVPTYSSSISAVLRSSTNYLLGRSDMMDKITSGASKSEISSSDTNGSNWASIRLRSVKTPSWHLDIQILWHALLPMMLRQKNL